MSKYHKGDKFIIEISKNDTNEPDTTEYYIINGSRVYEKEELDRLQKYEEQQIPYSEAYNKGLNDAWELAKKLWHNDARTNDDIYGIEYFIDIANEYTPQEALAKLEAYEKEQNEIKVGDVVEGKGSNTIGVVMRKNADDYCHILFRDGSVGQHEIGNFKKTGKHIDIQSLLEQIKE